MYGEILTSLGLSPNEAKIYESLLSSEEIGISEIALKANIHRRNVYDTMNRLIEKGLVSRIFKKDEHKFRAVNPEKLWEMLQVQERQLSTIMPELKKQFHSEPLTEAAYIYKGKEGYKNYLRDMISTAEDTYFLGAKGLWYTPWVDPQYLVDYQNAMTKKQKSFYTLYDYRVQKELPQALENVGGEYKILPEKYQSPGVTDVFGDFVVTFTSVGIGNFGEDGTIFVMQNEELAETYRTWFQLIWDSLGERETKGTKKDHS